MDKQNVVHTIKYYVALKNKGNSDICYNTDEPEDIMLTEMSQSQKDKYCMIPLI